MEQFDKYESFFEAITNVKNGQKVACEIDFLRDFTETLKLAKCSEQLREHPENHELDSSIARDDNMWDGFLRYYFCVIEDCPLKCSAEALKFADEVVIKAVKLPPAGDRLEIAALWIWKSKVTGETHTTPQRF